MRPNWNDSNLLFPKLQVILVLGNKALKPWPDQEALKVHVSQRHHPIFFFFFSVWEKPKGMKWEMQEPQLKQLTAGRSKLTSSWGQYFARDQADIKHRGVCLCHTSSSGTKVFQLPVLRKKCNSSSSSCFDNLSTLPSVLFWDGCARFLICCIHKSGNSNHKSFFCIKRKAEKGIEFTFTHYVLLQPFEGCLLQVWRGRT